MKKHILSKTSAYLIWPAFLSTFTILEGVRCVRYNNTISKTTEARFCKKVYS